MNSTPCRLIIRLAAAALLAAAACTQVEYDNPLDSRGESYEPLTIELVGEDPALVEVGTTYEDAGAMARSVTGEDLSGDITVSGLEDISTDSVDTFTVVYAVSDGNGFTAQCSRTVIVAPEGSIAEPLKPRITLVGKDTIYHTVHTPFADPGATAVDADGNDITAGIETTSTVDTSRVGIYTITYTITDSHGAQASRSRTVRVVEEHVVVDTIAPVISVLGDNPAQAQAGFPYVDEGAIATDETDGDVTASIVTSGTVNTDSAGIDTVTYTVSDRAGNEAVAIRVVHVVAGDTAAPTITLLGPDPLLLSVGDTLVDPGATANDDEDGDLTEQIVVEDNVDTRTPGTYAITYRVTDSQGNTAVKTRVVRVQSTVSSDTTPPEITLRGGDPLTLLLDEPFVDPGATAYDETDGDLTSRIRVTHNVDTATEGSYTVTYTVADNSSNVASATRTVEVVPAPPDTVAPVITLLGDNPLRVALGESFIDPGATATDDQDGDISARIEVTGDVDTQTEGTYTVTYTVSDAAGNTANETREVLVSEGGAAELVMDVWVAGDNNTTYSFETYANDDGWTPGTVKIIIQPVSGSGPISGSITINGTVHDLTSDYYNAFQIPNEGGTVTTTITGTFEIKLGL